jgi:hypothetical protein
MLSGAAFGPLKCGLDDGTVGGLELIGCKKMAEYFTAQRTATTKEDDTIKTMRVPGEYSLPSGRLSVQAQVHVESHSASMRHMLHHK